MSAKVGLEVFKKKEPPEGGSSVVVSNRSDQNFTRMPPVT